MDTTLNVHNLSSMTLSQDEIELLSKGLSFAPTPDQPLRKSYLQILDCFDSYARSVRQKYVHALYHSNTTHSTKEDTETSETSKIYRRMKFLHSSTTRTSTQQFSGVLKVEHYIELTKNNLNDQLPILTMKFSSNVTNTDKATVKKFKKIRNEITIKPADKNLGIVLLDTEDYISQCTKHLSDTQTYRLANKYPKDNIRKQLTNTVVSFKSQISGYSEKLYKFLLSEPDHSRIPQFYGIPKIHKKFTQVPPVRPIVSQCNSPLHPTARFIDHVLQPLAQSYPDYLHNSTSLSLLLQDLTVPDDALLVTLDVSNLYPSIPQTGMLQTIYEEMVHSRHLLLFDPNMVVRLLHTNINHNYFEFASLIFQQIKGTAMGAAYSPTIANIYMSVTIRRFLRTQRTQPLLLKRYIDDIIMIWTDTENKLRDFLTDLNQFNPALQYTFQVSSSSVDFLDLTIYKGPSFPTNNILDTKTYQKPHNLYQYLHYSSNHQREVYKSIILGELARYVRTNTSEVNYEALKNLFKQRLLSRGYPKKFIDTVSASVSYSDRPQLLRQSPTPQPKYYPPIYKCPPPPQFKLLKYIVLKNYHLLQKVLPSPRFIPLKHRTLGNDLLQTKLIPTDDQLIDIYTSVSNHTPTEHTTAGHLPQLSTQNARTTRCNHPRCATCKHLNCSKHFTSKRTGTTFRIRHSFSCNSSNLIYLITCTKCQKQYVGLTTKQLNIRINHHRTNIINKKPIYMCVHFNFPDHSLDNLSVQAIDKPPDNSQNMVQELKKLERHWITTLKTKQPLGLNVSAGNSVV